MGAQHKSCLMHCERIIRSMADSILIRPGELSDLAGVMQLLSESKLVPLDSDSQFGPQYVVAVCGEQIVGVAGIELYGDDGLLRSVCLHPQFRSLRIGAALVEDRIDWARDRTVRAIYLLTTTAAAYWPRFGFQTISRCDAPESLAQSREWSSAYPAESTAMRLTL